MKKVFGALIVLALSLGMNSCKDDDGGIPQNTFIYNGNSYQINNGYIEDHGANMGGSFDVDIYLASANVSYDTGFGDFVGFGDMAYLDLNTTSAGQLVTGTYNFSITRDAFTIVDGNILTGFNFTNLTGPEDEVIAGTVTVDVGSSNISIEFDLITFSGATVEGRYSGQLTEIL